jgi:hypothetical protein
MTNRPTWYDGGGTSSSSSSDSSSSSSSSINTQAAGAHNHRLELTIISWLSSQARNRWLRCMETAQAAHLMKANMTAAAGREMLVGSSSCLTTVTTTRKAIGSRHKITEPAGPLHINTQQQQQQQCGCTNSLADRNT